MATYTSQYTGAQIDDALTKARGAAAVSGVIKSNGSGTFSAAVAGTDFDAAGAASSAVSTHNSSSAAHSALFAAKQDALPTDGTADMVLSTHGGDDFYWRTVSGGGGGGSYADLDGKPAINGHTLASGANTLASLGIPGEGELTALGRDKDYGKRVSLYSGNIDSIAETTVYNISSSNAGTFPADRPADNPWEFIVSYMHRNDANHATQLLFGMTYSAAWMRKKAGGVWGAWVRLFDSGSTVPVTSGGTGATTAAAARSNLGALASANVSHETWTFTLGDDSTVNKEVALWVS